MVYSFQRDLKVWGWPFGINFKNFLENSLEKELEVIGGNLGNNFLIKFGGHYWGYPIFFFQFSNWVLPSCSS